jgi:hypothetical protein
MSQEPQLPDAEQTLKKILARQLLPIKKQIVKAVSAAETHPILVKELPRLTLEQLVGLNAWASLKGWQIVSGVDGVVVSVKPHCPPPTPYGD